MNEVGLFQVQFWREPLDIFDEGREAVVVGHRATLPEAKRAADAFIRDERAGWERGWTNHRKDGDWYHVRPFFFPDSETPSVMAIVPGRVGGST